MAYQVAQPAGVYGAELFNQNPGGFPFDLSFGSERRRPSASRCGGNDHDGSRQELLCLNDYGEAIAVLLMTYAAR